MSFILTIIGAMLALDLLWWWRADSLLRRVSSRWRTPGRAALGVFMAGQLGCLAWIVLSRVLGHSWREALPTTVLIPVFIWHFLVLTSVALLWALWGAGWSFGKLVGWVRNLAQGPAVEPVAPWPVLDIDPASGGDEPQPETAAAAGLSRRDFLGVAVAAVPPLATAVATGISIPQLDEFRVRTIHLPLAGLPRDLEGFSIAHVSDVHVGQFTTGRVLKKIVAATNELRSDLVLLTGDLINNALADLPAGLDAVRQMDGRHGVYMIEGNHDLIEDRYEFESRTRASGVPLLINESTTLKARGVDLQLLGLRWGSSDPRAPRALQRGDGAIADSMNVLLRQRHAGAFPILMAHHPHAFDVAASAGIPLTLAGHTHGGQLMLNEHLGFGPWMFRYWTGLYRQNDSALVVSNGVGNWFPLRIAAPAEIIHVVLHRA